MDLAHIREDGKVQTVDEHCRKTAEYAAQALENVHLSDAGYLAGLLHDAGKCRKEFQDYLLSSDQKRGSVIHTFQGCRMLLEHFHRDGASRTEDITCELMAYAVGAHHGQFDLTDKEGKSGFKHRMESERTSYEEAVSCFREECADWPEIELLFQKANAELVPVYGTIEQLIWHEDPEELHFYVGMLARLLLSAVIQGDRKDTAEFMNGFSAKEYHTEEGNFWLPYLEYMEEKVSMLPGETEVQQARRDISKKCRAFAGQPAGIYRLSVPTGAGKTLSSLRFALAHAAKQKKKRIIFTAPLLSIIDQNAAVIREYIGDDSVMLEHHANVIHTEGSDGRLDKRELLEESWDAPIIITSMVQLLQTFFSGRTSSIRRFQALCGSVIVMDEVQTVPNHMLSMFNLTVNFLTAVCDVTFVLCSATQPTFERAKHALLLSKTEMVPYQETLWKPFKRTEIIDRGNLQLENIPAELENYFRRADNMLVVCNTKKEAELIFRAFADSEIRCLHLSASMCMEHRRKVLREAEEAIAQSRHKEGKFLLVSTQVIEAGIDISFDCVVRLLAGMDSVVQAAGRCNRNGERAETSPVYLINCSDEKLGNLRTIQDGKTASVLLLSQYRSDRSGYRDSLSSGESIRQYYRNLYEEMPDGYQDYVSEDGKTTLLSMLAANTGYADGRHEEKGKYFMLQAFRTAGKEFMVFDTDTKDVVVPYGDGRLLINELLEKEEYDPVFVRKWIQKARPFTVSLYQNQLDRLAEGSVTEKYGISVLSDGWYADDIGFTINQGMQGYMEV